MNYIINLLFLILLSLFGYWIIFPKEGLIYNFEVQFLSLLIVIVSLYILFYRDKSPFSLNIVTNLFFVFFIGLSPAIQFQYGISFFEDKGKLTIDEFKLGNRIFLCVVLLYNIGYLFLKSKWKYQKLLDRKNIFKSENKYSDKGIIIIGLFFTLIILTYFEFDFKILLSRWYLSESYFSSNSTIYAVINVLRATPLLLIIFYKTSENSNLRTEFFLFILLVLLNFPTSIPRYRVAIIYLPVFLIYFKPLFKRYVFTVLYVLSFLIIFPFLSNFRHKEYSIKFPEINLNTFKTLNFDTFQNTLNVIVNNIITYGEQLIGVVLFFIPRKFWLNKPEGSHKVLAERLNYDGFSNVAISFFGEGFINFGYVGIVSFTLVLVFFNSKIDKLFWTSSDKQKPLLVVFYFILIPIILYLLRGSLMPSFANLVGYFVLGILLNELIQLTILKTPD